MPLANPAAGGDRELAAHLHRTWRRRRRTARRPRTSPPQQAPVDGARARAVHRARSTGEEQVAAGPSFVAPLLDSIVKARGGTGAPTAADSATLRADAARRSSTQMVGEPPAPNAAAARVRRSATTSRSIRRSASPAARARATASCSTSAIRRTRCASTPSPTRTSPTGTRRRSTTTAPRSCSPTSGAAAAARSAARPTRRSGARTRSSRSRTAR